MAGLLGLVMGTVFAVFDHYGFGRGAGVGALLVGVTAVIGSPGGPVQSRRLGQLGLIVGLVVSATHQVNFWGGVGIGCIAMSLGLMRAAKFG